MMLKPKAVTSFSDQSTLWQCPFCEKQIRGAVNDLEHHPHCLTVRIAHASEGASASDEVLSELQNAAQRKRLEYKLFSQYMKNDLGITTEVIQEMVRNAITQAISKMDFEEALTIQMQSQIRVRWGDISRDIVMLAADNIAEKYTLAEK